MQNITYARERKYTVSLSGSLLCLLSYATKTAKRPQVQSANDAPDPIEHTPHTPKRSKITDFSSASRRRLVKYTREIPKDRYKSFITLTYPTAPDPIETKSHLDRMLELLRRAASSLPSRHNSLALSPTAASEASARSNRVACRPQRPVAPLAPIAKKSKKKKAKAAPRSRAGFLRKPFSALWVMEYQERGVVHYHIWSSHYIDKAELQRLWNQIISAPAETPSTRVDGWKAYTKTGLSSYVAKYARKEAQKTLPEELAKSGAGRWWGKVGDVSTPYAIKKTISRDDFHRIRKICKTKGYKALPIEYCDLYVMPESDIIVKLKLIQEMGGSNDTETDISGKGNALL
jgi:hypothetical protein